MDEGEYGDDDIDALIDRTGMEPGDSPAEEVDEDGESAAATSAMADFAAALKGTDRKAQLAAFKELVGYCR